MLSAIYGKIIDFRNALYDRGVFETHDLGARTISIGNITTGGTGKTPLVVYVANALHARGEKVCILTRGYGRENSKQRVLVSDGEKVLADVQQAGDEPLELAQKLLGKAIVIADADRVAAAEWAKRRFGVTIFVLDDGFQHRKAKRDLDIVCVDATNPFGGGKLLPAGRLREPVDNLSRADTVVITRANLIDPSMISDLKLEILRSAPDASVFIAANAIANAEEQVGKRVFAFAGIGNPESFFALLRGNNIDVIGTRIFADHHKYLPSDAADIDSAARSANANILATTQKDLVKLSDLKFEIPIISVVLETEIENGDAFEELL